MKKLLFCTLLLTLYSITAFANIYKCVGEDGIATYSDSPCGVGSELAFKDSSSSISVTESIDNFEYNDTCSIDGWCKVKIPLPVNKSPLPVSSSFQSVKGDKNKQLFIGGHNLPLYQYNGTWNLNKKLNNHDIWQIGRTNDGNILIPIENRLFHFDGDKMDEISLPIGKNVFFSPKDIWGKSINNFVAVGHGYPSGEIWHYLNGEWTKWNIAQKDIPEYGLLDVWGSSNNDIFAVGSSSIFHFDGEKWECMLVSSKVTHNLYGVWGTDANNVYVVGANETILHYDGNDWSFIKKRHWGLGQTFRAVWGTDKDNIFIVGDFGYILHFNGVAWVKMESGTKERLNNVWGFNDENIIITGDHVILHRYTSEAKPQKIPKPIQPIPNQKSFNGRFVSNIKAGTLFIITGEVDNPTASSISHVEVEGTLITKGKIKAMTQTAFCGNSINENDLMNEHLSAIKKQLMIKNGLNNINVNIRPEETVPFMIVFSDLPKGLQNFTVKVKDFDISN